MPPYATVMDVARLEPERAITANSRPSASDVIGYLTDTAAELDAALAARKYRLPVQAPSAGTATLALALLRRVNAQGAHALVQTAAAATKQGTMGDSWQRYQDALRALQDGRMELPDAASDAAQQVAI